MCQGLGTRHRQGHEPRAESPTNGSSDVAMPSRPGSLKPSPDVLASLERLAVVVADPQAASHGDPTIESYTRQWRRFAKWCAARALASALPVPTELVMLYVDDKQRRSTSALLDLDCKFFGG